MLRQLLSGPTTTDGGADAGNLAMLSNVAATTLPFATSSVSGTSELFSSTFAMLSEGDGIADSWEKPRAYENGMEEFARFGGEFGHQFDQAAHRLPLLGYPGMPHPIGLPGHAPLMSYGMPAAVAAAAAAGSPMAVFGLPMTAPPQQPPRMQHSAFHPHQPIPIAPQTAPVSALRGSPDDGRPQNGRAFVETMGAGGVPPKSTVLPSGTASESSTPGAGSPPKPGKGMVSSTGEGGLSPICPYCERFISHYKGNIRRHINQCCKNGGKRLKTPKNPMCGGTSSTSGKRRKFAPGEGPPSGEGWVQGGGGAAQGEMTLYEHVAANFNGVPQQPPTAAPPQPMIVGGGGASMQQQQLQQQPQPVVQQPVQQQLQSNPLYDLPPSTNSSDGGMHHPDSTTPPKKTSESDVPDDPYLCPYCDFLTVYKGNMKRHLNTCHPVEMEKGDKRLDDMRASVQGVANEELNAKLNAHKMNSTRGRKPKVSKLGMDTSGSGLSPNGDHSLGSGGSSTTSPMSTTADPYYRPPVSGHMLQGAHPPMMSYAPMGYPQAPQHLLMVAPGVPPPSVYGYHPMQQLPAYLQQAPPPPQHLQRQQQQSVMTSSASDVNATSTSRENGMKKEVKSEDESDFEDDEEDSEDEDGKDASAS